MCVYFQENKKRRRPREDRCHTETMMSTKANDSLKINTHHVPLRQNTEEKIRGKELEVVWDDVNE